MFDLNDPIYTAWDEPIGRWYTMKKAAKKIGIKGIGQNKLYEILRSEGFIENGFEPVEKYVEMGILKMEWTSWDAYGRRVGPAVRVSERGIGYLRKYINDRIKLNKKKRALHPKRRKAPNLY